MNGLHDPGELSAHALGLLGGAQARAVEQHLTDCAACRREWSELRETARLLVSAEEDNLMTLVPPLTVDRVVARQGLDILKSCL